MTPTKRIALLIFDEVEVLDACGPFEVFSVAGRIASADRAVPPPVEVTALSAGPTTTIRARGGLRIVADRLLADAPPTVDVADLSLHLVARLLGARHAAATSRQMDYPWVDDPVASPV
jgi:transcriptional regulator GlxA family with amidase domain